VDGVQALGKIPVDLEAVGIDLYSVSGHKIYGPRVWVRCTCAGARSSRPSLSAAIMSGPPPRHGERSRHRGIRRGGRSGRLQLASEGNRLTVLRDRLENAVASRISGVTVNGSRWKRTANTSNMCFEAIEGEALVIALDLRGFAVSTGAACSSGAVAPSHVLTAIGLPPERARASMRFFAWPRQHRRAGGRARGRA